MLAPCLALYEQISLPVAGLCTVTFFPVTFFPTCPLFLFSCHFIHTATQMNCYLFSCFFFSHLSTVTFFPVTFFPTWNCYFLSCFFFSHLSTVTFFPVTFFPTWNCYFLSCYLFSCYFLSVHQYDCKYWPHSCDSHFIFVIFKQILLIHIMSVSSMIVLKWTIGGHWWYTECHHVIPWMTKSHCRMWVHQKSCHESPLSDFWQVLNPNVASSIAGLLSNL